MILIYSIYNATLDVKSIATKLKDEVMLTQLPEMEKDKLTIECILIYKYLWNDMIYYMPIYLCLTICSLGILILRLKSKDV